MNFGRGFEQGAQAVSEKVFEEGVGFEIFPARRSTITIPTMDNLKDKKKDNKRVPDGRLRVRSSWRRIKLLFDACSYVHFYESIFSTQIQCDDVSRSYVCMYVMIHCSKGWLRESLCLFR